MKHRHSEKQKAILRANGVHGHKGGRPRKGSEQKTLAKPLENPLKNSGNLSDALKISLLNLAIGKKPDIRAIKLLLNLENRERDELLQLRDRQCKLADKRTTQLLQFQLRGKTAPDWLYDEIKFLEDDHDKIHNKICS